MGAVAQPNTLSNARGVCLAAAGLEAFELGLARSHDGSRLETRCMVQYQRLSAFPFT